jgi:hypothetical protein
MSRIFFPVTGNNVSRIFTPNSPSDADLSIDSVSNKTNTVDATEAINIALQGARAVTGGRVEIVGAHGTTGIHTQYTNDVTMIMPGGGLFLLENSNVPIFRNAHYNYKTPIQRNITITGGGILHGNRNGQLGAKIHPVHGVVSAINMYGAEKFLLSNIELRMTKAYGVHGIGVRHCTYEDIIADQGPNPPLNTDILHMDNQRGGMIRRITILSCGDDAICNNNSDAYASSTYGDGAAPGFFVGAEGEGLGLTIQDVWSENVGRHLIRILSAGDRTDWVTLRNIKGWTKEKWLIMDAYLSSGVLTPGTGNGGRILVEDCDVHTSGPGSVNVDYSAAQIGMDCEQFIIRNTARNTFDLPGFPSYHFMKGNIGLLSIEGYQSLDKYSAYVTPHIRNSGAFFDTIKLGVIDAKRLNGPNSSTLYRQDGGGVKLLQYSGITTVGLNSIMDVTAGYVGDIVAQGLAIAGTAGDDTTTGGIAFYSTVPVNSITVSNWSPLGCNIVPPDGHPAAVNFPKDKRFGDAFLGPLGTSVPVTGGGTPPTGTPTGGGTGTAPLLNDAFTTNPNANFLSTIIGNGAIDTGDGKLKLTPPSNYSGYGYASVVSVKRYNLYATTVDLHVVSVLNSNQLSDNNFGLTVNTDIGQSNNKEKWIIANGKIAPEDTVNVVNNTVLDYNPSDMQWLRMYADTTNLYWRYSANGTDYGTAYSKSIASLVAQGLDLSSVLIYMSAATNGPVDTPGSFVMDRIIVTPR